MRKVYNITIYLITHVLLGTILSIEFEPLFTANKNDNNQKFLKARKFLTTYLNNNAIKERKTKIVFEWSFIGY